MKACIAFLISFLATLALIGILIDVSRLFTKQPVASEVRLDCDVISFPSSILGTSLGDRLLMQCNIEDVQQ